MNEAVILSLRYKLKKIEADVMANMRRQRVNEAWIVETHGIFEGCTEQEIRLAKEAQQVDFLPDMFVQYLRVMGNYSGGHVLRGADYGSRFYPWLKRHLIADLNDRPEYPDLFADAFVFLSYQEVEYFFFRTGQHDQDPPVYFYRPRMTEFLCIADKLSVWFHEQLVSSDGPLLEALSRMVGGGG